MFMRKIIFSNPINKNQNTNFRNIKEKISKNIIFRIFVTVLFIGIIFGAISGRNANDKLMESLDLIFLTNFKVRCSQGALAAFSASFASSFIFLLAVFLLGLSVWGGYIAVFLPFIKGYGYGLSAGYLYCTYGLNGILYNILIILPGAFLCSIIISAACQQALKFSFRQTVFFALSAVSDDIRVRMREYIKSMLWLFIFSAAASAADMLFSLMFSWIFEF